MKIENERKRCSECGGDLQSLNEGLTVGVICHSCGWTVVTTDFPEILEGRTQYEIIVLNGDHRNLGHIRAVAYLAGVNFLEAHKLLQSLSGLVVYRGDASELGEVISKLISEGLYYRVEPPLAYPLPSPPVVT